MQMHSPLCTHIMPVSPLDLAVQPGHDDALQLPCQSVCVPLPSIQNRPVWLLFDDIWSHPTDAHVRLTVLHCTGPTD